MDNLKIFLGYIESAIVFMLVITVLVAVHEFGHYWVARMFGIKVNSFSIMVGGKRTTDLSPYLAKPILPSRIVLGAGLAVFALMLAGAFARVPALFTLGLAGLAVGMPIWIISRLQALYRLPGYAGFRTLAIWWIIGQGYLGFSTRLQGVGITQVLVFLLFGSFLALLFTYYTPVMNKQEGTPQGEGELEWSSGTMAVQFRPLAHRTDKHGTEFSILALPLGGFVQVDGMQIKPDGSETTIPGGFYSRGPFSRFLMLFAGPFFSVAFGVLILTGVFAGYGVERPLNKPVIGLVGPDGPAAKAGLKAGDRVTAVDGVPVTSFYEIVVNVRDKNGAPVQIDFVRAGKAETTIVRPVVDKTATTVVSPDLEPTEQMKIQSKLMAGWTMETYKLPIGQAFTRAVSFPLQTALGLLQIVKRPSEAGDSVGGVGSVAAATHQATEAGLKQVLGLAGLLSISLGIMNLLPVYPLDGGQMVVAFVEMLRRGKRLSFDVQRTVSTVGTMLVFVLIATVLMLDVKRFTGTPSEQTSQKSQK